MSIIYNQQYICFPALLSCVSLCCGVLRSVCFLLQDCWLDYLCVVLVILICIGLASRHEPLSSGSRLSVVRGFCRAPFVDLCVCVYWYNVAWWLIFFKHFTIFILTVEGVEVRLKRVEKKYNEYLLKGEVKWRD